MKLCHTSYLKMPRLPPPRVSPTRISSGRDWDERRGVKERNWGCNNWEMRRLSVRDKDSRRFSCLYRDLWETFMLKLQPSWSEALCLQATASRWGELTMSSSKKSSHLSKSNKATDELNMNVSLLLAVHRETLFLLSMRQLSQHHCCKEAAEIVMLW